MEKQNKSVVSHLSWAFLDQFSVKGISIIVSIVLARILSPTDFGMMGLLYFFTAISQELIDGGLSASLIRRNDTNVKDNSTIFFTNVFVGLIIYALLFSIAPFFATYYQIPKLELLLKVYGLIFIINAFSNVQLTLLTKELLFRKVMMINLPGIIIGASVGVWMAISDYGVWSIVFMQLVTQGITAILLWTTSHNVKLFFSFTILKKHFDFGAKIMLSSILNASFRNVTNLVIGKVFNVRELGFFERAKTISMYPNYVFVGILTKVFYPLLSKIKDEAQLITANKKIIDIAFYLSLATMMLLAVVAYPLFGIVLGTKWLTAVPLFQVFCIKSALHPLLTLHLNFLKVKGFSGQLFKVEFYNRIIGFIALLIGLYFELFWLVVLLTLADFIAYFNIVLVTQKFHKYALVNQLKSFAPTVLLALSSGLICWFTRKMWPVDLISWNNLFIQTTAFILSFIALSFLFGNKNFKFIIDVFINKIRQAND